MKMSVVKTCVVGAGRWAWFCPFLMLGLAVAILILFGLSAWTAILVAILLVCPAVIVWGMIQTRCRKP
jgi:phosphoethanolamine N-methyltransferase